MDTVIWWLRRDLRLHDNQALHAALEHGARVIPVFVLDPALWHSPYVGDKRLAFLLGGLRALDANLRARGSRLIVRRGRPPEVLSTMMRKTRAEAIFAEGDVSPYARKRDAAIAAKLPLHFTSGLTAHAIDAVSKKDGRPYIVYTPYSRAWRALPLPDSGDLLPTPESIETPEGLSSIPIPGAPGLLDAGLFVPGETEAQRRLAAFTSCIIDNYSIDRNRMDLDGTSGLSPYLRFGMLSARQAVVAALYARDRAATCEAQEGADTWLSELIWREFYLAVLYHFPNVRRESFRENLRGIRWSNDATTFAAWQTGRTGYPVVDAGMRQLAATGWMHNRARMIVASFLTKHLLIDWRWGERHFMQHLIDGDPASNNGGWQWSAGTGTDAAPYFRIFNPILQGEKYDPDGDYVRRWVPELANVPRKYIHRPWTMPSNVQREAGCAIGTDYPAPIVEHKWARERALTVYKAARERAG